MQDLRKNKRKMNNKPMSAMSNFCEPEAMEDAVAEARRQEDELDRGCKCNNQNMESQKNKNKCHEKHEKVDCGCYCECKDNKHHEVCEECEAVSESCTVNPCRQECCNGISPTFSTKNASPIAIEANRIFDSIQFRTFTDATASNGQNIFFDFEVIEVMGNIPPRGTAKVIVDEVCVNFSTIDITPGDITVDDFVVTPIENNSSCDTVFESLVCTRRNSTCCARNMGQNVLFRERGLNATVNDLVLEIRGHCGCTKIVALAFPAVRRANGQLCRVDSVDFRFNTLASNLCIPSSGRTVTLRQSYLTNLTVDCISNAFISADDCEFDCNISIRRDCDCDCNCDCDDDADCDCLEFTIPSGIDLILCIEETVSDLIGDQMVVLADTGFEPRVVDTFANVCRFPGCDEN